MHRLMTAFIVLTVAISAAARAPELATARAPAAHERGTARSFEEVIKSNDDVLWYFKLGDVASIDKVHFTSKPERMSNPTGQGAGNAMIIPAYVFTPKSAHGKVPLIALIHGGVHGDFNTSYASSAIGSIRATSSSPRRIAGPPATAATSTIRSTTAGRRSTTSRRPATGRWRI